MYAKYLLEVYLILTINLKLSECQMIWKDEGKKKKKKANNHLYNTMNNWGFFGQPTWLGGILVPSLRIKLRSQNESVES